MPKKNWLLLIGVCTLNLANSQTTVKFQADKDNSITSASRENSNGAGEYFFAGVSGEPSKLRGLLHFNLSAIPAGSVITAATLTLNINKSGSAATGIELHKLTSDWGEGTSDAGSGEGKGAAATTSDATWNQNFFPSSAWTTSGGDFSSTVSAAIPSISSGISSGTPVTLTGPNVVADVQSWITSPASNFGWIIKSDNEITPNSGKRFISRNHPSTTSRPSLSVTYSSGPLPVNLNRFSGSLSGQNAVLHWVTATETDNKYFDIQHSNDGQYFASIGQIAGNGTSSVEHSYSFTHKNIGTGKHLYRIVQNDLNGIKRISNVISLSLNSTLKLQVYPNPAVSFVTVTTSSLLQGADFTISSYTGQVVKKGKINDGQIDVQRLSPGQYWLTVKTSNDDILKSGFLKK